MNEKFSKVKNKMEKFMEDSQNYQDFHYQGLIDSKIYAGDTSVFEEIYNLNKKQRKNRFGFNRVRRIINMISGHQRNNRKSLTCVPLEGSDERTAYQFTSLFFRLMQNDNMDYTISDAFKNALITGLGLLELYVDYSDDHLNGDIKLNKLEYNSFILDPFMKKTDLSDCKGIVKRLYLSQEEAMQMFPQYKEYINKNGLITPSSGPSTKYGLMSENYAVGGENLLSCDVFYYRDYRKRKIIRDKSGRIFEWDNENKEMIEELSKKFGTKINIIKEEIPTVKMAIKIEDTFIYDGENNLGIDDYPFIPIYCYFNPSMPYYDGKFQSVVYDLRDSQYLYNRRMTLELEQLELQSSPNFLFKEGAPVNVEDLYNVDPGRAIPIKDEYQISDIMRLPSGDIPPNGAQLTQLIAQEINQISGVNEELLGFDQNDNKAGILNMLRQSAGVVTLNQLFDNLDMSLGMLGKLLIRSIQKNYNYDKVRRILKEDPSVEFYSKAFGKYGCSIEEGFNTSTQKQLQFAQMLRLKEMGINIPEEEFINTANIQNKDKIIEFIKTQNQIAQQQSEADREALLKDIELKTAQTNLVNATAYERETKAKENISSSQRNISTASKYDQDAELDKAKALKELENIDIKQLEKLIKLAKYISKTSDYNKMEIEQKAGITPEIENKQNLV